MTKEFNLSDKVGHTHSPVFKIPCDVIMVKDVKEFIKRLKGLMNYLEGVVNFKAKDVNKRIDKIAGDDLK